MSIFQETGIQEKAVGLLLFVFMTNMMLRTQWTAWMARIWMEESYVLPWQDTAALTTRHHRSTAEEDPHLDHHDTVVVDTMEGEEADTETATEIVAGTDVEDHAHTIDRREIAEAEVIQDLNLDHLEGSIPDLHPGQEADLQEDHPNNQGSTANPPMLEEVDQLPDQDPVPSLVQDLDHVMPIDDDIIMLR